MKLTKINIVTAYDLSDLYKFKPEGAHVLSHMPEATFHPREQADYADGLIEAVAKYPYPYIVRTFSESLILRFRRRIAEGKLDPNDVKIFLITKDQSTFLEFTFNSNGDVIGHGWPADFFSVEYEDICAMNRANRNKGN